MDTFITSTYIRWLTFCFCMWIRLFFVPKSVKQDERWEKWLQLNNVYIAYSTTALMEVVEMYCEQKYIVGYKKDKRKGLTFN